MSGNVTFTTTIANAQFSPPAGTFFDSNETINGTLHSTYNSAGTLVGETGSVVMTETDGIGIFATASTETFAITGTSGINNANPGSFQITLGETGSTGGGPFESSLVLAWASETQSSLTGSSNIGGLALSAAGTETTNFAGSTSTGLTIVTDTPVTNSTSVSFVINSFSTAPAPTFSNTGTVSNPSGSPSAAGAGVFLDVGGTSVPTSITNSGKIIGFEYGIDIAQGNSAVTGTVNISNAAGGLIEGTNSTSTTQPLRPAGIYFGQDIAGSIVNAGTIEGAEGVWLLPLPSQTESVTNLAGGTIIGTANEGAFYGIKIQEINGGFGGSGIIKNYGVISGMVDDAVLNVNITNAGTIKGSGNGQAIFAVGSGTLTVDQGANFGNQTIDFVDENAAGVAQAPDSTLILNSTIVSPTSTQLTNPGSYVGFGTVDVASGANWAIGTVNTTVGIGQTFSGGTRTGGVANSPAITIAAGGVLGVTGTVTDPLVVQGTLNVNSASVTGVLISGAGALAQIYAGGSVTNLNIVSGGDANVVQTGIIIGGTVASGGTENVGLKNAGVNGSATGTTIGAGGLVDVNSLGSATGEIVSGGVLSVTQGGEVFATKVSSGGTEIVSGNGVSGSAIGSGSVIGSGGTEILLNGGVEIPANVSGGNLTAGVGGEVISTTVSGGGTEVISGNGTGSSAIGSGSVIGSGGTEIVLSGGTEIPATVLSGGTITAGPGGEVISTHVSSGGTEIVSGNGLGSSAIGSGSVISAGGTEIVLSGGTEIPPSVIGVLSVGGSGEVISAQVSSGGTEIISGTGSSGSAIGSGSVVSSGGTEILSAGGVEIPGTVSSGGVVIVSSGGVFSGTVSSGGTLSLGAGGSVTTGTVSGAGTYDLGPVYLISGGYITGLPNNATGYVVPVGGTEVVASGGFATGSIVNSGAAELVLSGGDAEATVISSGGTQTVRSGGDIGSSLIGTGGTEILSGGALDTGVISFTGSGGTLVIGGPLGSTPANGILAGFTSGTGNGVVFSGVPYTSGGTVTYNNGILTVADSGQTYTLSGVAEPGNGVPFSLVNDGGVLEVIPCYAAGTRILTEEGDRLVEDLAVGDVVVTVMPNGPATRKVVWTGRRAIDIARHPNPAIVRPVRILAGAFGAGLPERDLRVSPHHAIFVDGALFEAISLVNGSTIVQEQNTGHVTYHHIELDGHDLMLAEGLPAESFLDTGNRDMFENTQGAIQLHADFRTAANAPTCLPIIRAGAALDAAHAKLAALAAGFSPQRRVSRG